MRVGDEVRLAVALAHLGVAQAVGRRDERLAQQHHLARGERRLAAACAHHVAGDTDVVAALMLEREREGIRAEHALVEQHLQDAGAVLEVEERQAAVATRGGHPARRPQTGAGEHVAGGSIAATACT